jgi:hypothetical protein
VRLSHHPQPTTDTEKNQGRVRFPNPKDRAKTMSLPEASSFSEWMGGVSRQQNNEEIIKNHKKNNKRVGFCPFSEREREKKVKRANATIDRKQHTRVTLISSFSPLWLSFLFLETDLDDASQKRKGEDADR